MDTFIGKVANMECQAMQTVPLSHAPTNGFRGLRMQQVLDKTGLSRTHTYRLIKQGDHPKPVQLSERVYVWNEASIDAWLEAKFSSEQNHGA